MKTIKELVDLLQTLPELDTCPNIDVDEDGDLQIEWYYPSYNVVILSIPTDGSEPYIVYQFKSVDHSGHTKDLSKLKEMVCFAQDLGAGKE